jgi:hypothetical protein
MARFEKVDPKDGSFRAPLGFNIAADAVGVPVGVGINASGMVIAGPAGIPARIVGVVVPSNPMNVGDAIDVMTDGEIADVTGFLAGAQVAADVVTGLLHTSAATGETGTRVGFCVQAWRLVVRIAR